MPTSGTGTRPAKPWPARIEQWLERLITRREKPENFKQALEREPDDIKVIIQFSDI